MIHLQRGCGRGPLPGHPTHPKLTTTTETKTETPPLRRGSNQHGPAARAKLCKQLVPCESMACARTTVQSPWTDQGTHQPVPAQWSSSELRIWPDQHRIGGGAKAIRSSHRVAWSWHPPLRPGTKQFRPPVHPTWPRFPHGHPIDMSVASHVYLSPAAASTRPNDLVEMLYIYIYSL